MSFNLKKLRDQYGISQEYMAKQLNVSRPTYIQIEKGEKELTVSQMKTLVKLFGSDSKIEEKMPTIKIEVPETNLAKFKEVLLYILAKVGAKPNIGETALYKLLYFIDFDFYEKHGKPLIGATYIKNHHGPTPVQFKKIADEMLASREIELVKSKYFQYDQKKYLPLREPDLEKFTVTEVQHIDDELVRLACKNASELSSYSHEDVPWQATDNQTVIDYNLVFQRLMPYAQKNYEEMMMNASASDVLKRLGPMSDEEYNYYNSL